MDETRVVLIGGPQHLGDDDRIRLVSGRPDKIKVAARNGYEHFTATDQLLTVGDTELLVFAWVDRTKFAE